MSSLFAKIIRQAKITFDHKNIEIFRTNFNELKLLVDQLKIQDLNINTNLISREAFSTQAKAPCTFVDIYENDHFTMSVFILKQNFTMPIHDHPNMVGILRCIAGNLNVQSFSAKQTDPVRIGEINVRAEPSKILTISTESAILTPKSGNYHEITAGDEISAFFDILAPPYESPIYGVRKCNFYRKIEESLENVILQRVPTPSTYYCDSGHYEPPDVLKAEM